MIATTRLLTVTNIAGITEPLTDFSSFSRTRSLNNEQTLSLTVFPTDRNRAAFPLIEEESLLDFDGDTYVIKKVSERSVGRATVKQIDAVHKFYVDLANKQQRTVYNGTITFNDYMKLVFEGTGYTFLAVDSFSDQDFDNLGNDSRLALLQKAIERWGCEFKLVGNEVRFYKQIGDDIDFPFRYGYNIKTIQRDVDTTNLRTVIHGSGANGIELDYRSPNADIFGEIEAPAIDDDRFTTEESLLEEMKSQLQDTPEMSITIDFADLRAAGYPYDFPEIGDRVFVIYEPMNNLRIETRLIEVTEEFDVNFRPIQTSVTLANVQKSLASTLLNTVNTALSRIANDDGTIKFDFLDQAVKQATQALQSAQTELEFNNGIIARDKNDANNIVVFNSAGLGISSDGGRTFRTAMTGAGIVADVITAGTMRGVTIISDDGQGNSITIEDGALISKINDRNMVKLNNYEIYFYDNGEDDPNPDYSEVATTGASWLSEDPTSRGFEISGYKDFVVISKNIDGTSGRIWQIFDFRNRITKIYGGDEDRDDGKLHLYSTIEGGTANGYVPGIEIENFTDGSRTPWSGVFVYTGRDNRSPANDSFRSGFEVWQFRGTGNGAAKQMLKIDTNSDGVTYTGVYTDRIYLPKKTWVQASNGQYYNVPFMKFDNDISGLQGMPGIFIDKWTNFHIGSSGGAYSYGYGDYSLSGFENVFAVFVQVTGSWSNSLVAGVENISSSGFRVYVRGTGATDSIAGIDVTLNIMIIYEPS